MNTLTTPKCFNAKGKAHKVFTIILHTMQVIQATSLPKVQPKSIFNISGDHLTPNMAIVLYVHALHFGRTMNIEKQKQQFKHDIPIKNSWQEWTF
jgi:hypothetical protein